MPHGIQTPFSLGWLWAARRRSRAHYSARNNSLADASQYSAESLLAVGTNRTFVTSRPENSMTARSIGSVARVRRSPPPIATMLCVCGFRWRIVRKATPWRRRRSERDLSGNLPERRQRNIVRIMATETLVSTSASGSTVQSGPLNQADVEFYHENGFLRIPEVFTPAESQVLADDLDRLAREWATVDKRWTGPWRKVYMDEETEKTASLEAMHALSSYSQPWLAAVTNPKLVACLVQLLGPDIELHHSVMHNKPPGGQPFPMHQDHPFYPHDDGRYVDVLIHLDDTCHDNGEIRFLAGSHKQGPLPHILGTEEEPSAPHLPTDQYRLADSVAVPAKRGDVVGVQLLHRARFLHQRHRPHAAHGARRLPASAQRPAPERQHRRARHHGRRLPRAPRRRTTAASLSAACTVLPA